MNLKLLGTLDSVLSVRCLTSLGRTPACHALLARLRTMARSLLFQVSRAWVVRAMAGALLLAVSMRRSRRYIFIARSVITIRAVIKWNENLALGIGMGKGQGGVDKRIRSFWSWLIPYIILQ